MRLRVIAALAASAVAHREYRATTDPVDVFIAGQPSSVNNYRIPAVVQTGTGALLAFSEARTQQSDCAPKALVARRSVDFGATWGEVITVYQPDFARGLTAGNPAVVWDAAVNKTIVHFAVGTPQKCNPTAWTMQVDDGGSDGTSWGDVVNISAALGKWAGILPGPGAGVVMSPASAHPGRIVFPGHMGAYVADTTWYSDDHGGSWHVSDTALPAMDEPALAETSDGRLLLNMRNDHANACDCQATSVSADGGATWSLPVAWDAALVSPVCQGTLTSIAGALYYANPASKTDRANITIRRSDDDGATWNATTWVASPGPSAGGYSCLTSGAPVVVDPSTRRAYGGILYERNAANGTEAISFRLFPLDLQP